MNTLTRTLAQLDPEAGTPTEITARDEDLLRAIMATPLADPPRRQRTHVRRTLVVGGLVAATVALGLMKIDIGGHDVGASPAAAEVLERAAAVTIESADPVVRPGQYLHITRVELKWLFNGTEKEAIRTGSDGKPVVYQQRWIRESWIPYDRDDPRVSRFGITPVRSISKDAISLNTRVPTETRVRSGDSRYGDEAAWYATLPRDPSELKEALMATEPGRSLQFYVEDIFSQVLQSGVAPADIRAALFEALADTAGVTMLDGVANLDGRAGVAIGYHGGNTQMLFDRDTGAYIGERATSPDFPDVPGLDADKTTWLSTVRTEVVDSAPKPD